MKSDLRTWTTKRGSEVGVTVTEYAVEFWQVERCNVHSRVPLVEFVGEHLGVSQVESLLGEEKTIEVFDYVETLLEGAYGHAG